MKAKLLYLALKTPTELSVCVVEEKILKIWNASNKRWWWYEQEVQEMNTHHHVAPKTNKAQKMIKNILFIFNDEIVAKPVPILFSSRLINMLRKAVQFHAIARFLFWRVHTLTQCFLLLLLFLLLCVCLCPVDRFMLHAIRSVKSLYSAHRLLLLYYCYHNAFATSSSGAAFVAFVFSLSIIQLAL